MRRSLVGRVAASDGSRRRAEATCVPVFSRRDMLVLAAGACLAPLTAGLGSCSSDGGAQTGGEQDDSSTRTVTDLGGNAVEVSSAVERYAVLWVAGTDILAMLDGLSHIVMYPDVSGGYPLLFDFYPGMAGIPSCDAEQASAEEVIAQGAQVVFMRASDNPDLAERLASAGVATVDIAFNSYDGLKDAVALVADVLNTDEARAKARDWCAYFDEMLSACDALVQEVSGEPEPTAIVIRDTSSYQVYGSGRFAGQWVERCGGDYVLDTGDPTGYVNITKEQLLAYDPDYIFFIFEGCSEELMADPSLQQLTAVKNGHVFDNPAVLNTWSNHGCEAVLQFAWARHTMYPEFFGTDGLEDEVARFFETFFGLQLGDRDFSVIFPER
ncbi:MAG TPA: ABC transporter substrate-binding protein [Candidatus Coprousia avicola]|nr:ABC transporter substrate-binding protein [Candidatus Coprousia avicola]